MAARKARAATAYGAGLGFHRAAAPFLKDAAFSEYLWTGHPELALSFLQEWAESEFLEGDKTHAEHLIEEALQHARTSAEKAEALIPLILQNTLLARYPKAIAAGRQAMRGSGNHSSRRRLWGGGQPGN